MIRQFTVTLFAAVLAVFGGAAPALAVFDLSITEIWPGNEPDDNLSADWFEITNSGDMAWTAASDGELYYDDESFNVGDATLVNGIASIPAGGSAIVLIGDEPTDGIIAEWTSLWSSTSPVNLNLFPVGWTDGAGLGQGGDAVGIWIGTPSGVPDLFATYPDATLDGGQSYDVSLGAFSVVDNANGAVMTTTVSNMGQAAVGSPGTRVPEPGSLLLIALGIAACTASYRGR